jgi:hypothetical protein
MQQSSMYSEVSGSDEVWFTVTVMVGRGFDDLESLTDRAPLRARVLVEILLAAAAAAAAIATAAAQQQLLLLP